MLDDIIGATLYVTMVTCHRHFWKWWWLSPPLFQSGICNSYKTTLLWQKNFLATRSVLWLKICRKCDSWGAHDAPRPHAPPSRRLWRLDARAFGASIAVPPDTKSWRRGRRHWSPPLFKVKLRQWMIFNAASILVDSCTYYKCVSVVSSIVVVIGVINELIARWV